MKAQLSFEFYFTLVVFIIFISFLFFKLLTFFPLYSTEIELQRLRSEAYQVSEILVNDVGYPGNWDSDVPNAKKLGLSDETRNKTNLLSLSKVTEFNTLCVTGQGRVRELLGIEDQFLILFTLKEGTPQNIIQCAPTELYAKTAAEVKRVVALDSGEFGELTVRIWEV